MEIVVSPGKIPYRSLCTLQWRVRIGDEKQYKICYLEVSVCAHNLSVDCTIAISIFQFLIC